MLPVRRHNATRPNPTRPLTTLALALAFLSRAVLALPMVLTAGCLASIDRSRDIVNHLRFHGVNQVSVDTMQSRIGTRPTDRFLGIALPWTPPQYYDDTTFRRDLERIERFYQSEGYYSAAIQSVHVERESDGRNLDIDVSVREGPPTQVGSVWLSGCEPESRRETDMYPVPLDTCATIRERLHLGYGVTFTEAGFDADRALITDLLKDEGYAVASVRGSATVDPVLRRVNVVYVLDAGPKASFGEIRVFEAAATAPVTAGRLPDTGYPVSNIRRAVNILRGDPYSRTALSEAQRRLFALGAFGIVRIVEQPHRCDARGKCDAEHDPSDRRQQVVVDVDVRLTAGRRDRLRFGGGFEVDQQRSDVHLGVTYEHRLVPLPGGMGRFRVEERPLVFLPLCLGECQISNASLGNSLAFELREPQVWRSGTLILNGSWDLGPDPINPGLTDRSAARLGFGAQHEFVRRVVGGLFLRTNRLDYGLTWFKTASEADAQQTRLALDPIASQQYISQTYTYLEEQFTWDARDEPLRTHRGFFISMLGQQSAAIPYISHFAFLRGSVDLRWYLPLGEHVVFAVRGFAGVAAGYSNDPATRPGGWPVPQELRFYSGGSTSNRGYPFARVGYVATVPTCPGQSAGTELTAELARDCATAPHLVDNRNSDYVYQGQPDRTRYTSIGGLTAWEFSAELRAYFGDFGAVLFFDASDVGGWMPSNPVPDRPRTLASDPPYPTPTPPGPTVAIGLDPHPSGGIGLRYLSPIGVVRVDLGLRLDDLDCSRYKEEVVMQGGQAASGPLGESSLRPWYYVFSRPRCDVFGLQLPLAIQFAIGEVF